MTYPDLYPFAAFLARRFTCTHIIAVGAVDADELARACPDLQIVTIHGAELVEERVVVPHAILERSVIVCANLIDWRREPRKRLNMFRSWLAVAPVSVLTADLPEWTLTEFEDRLQLEGLNIAFVGRTATDDRDYAKDTILAILERSVHTGQKSEAIRPHAPPGFRATAIVPAYNEADIIAPSLQKLIDQRVNVYVIENWSTDDTYEIAAQFAGQGVTGIERFPAAGPSRFYDWRAILRRLEELTLELESDWFLFQSVDEVRRSPWPNVDLLDAFYRVETHGFNAVDFTVAEFHPIDNGYPAGSDFERYFRHRFDFGKHPAHLREINAWKNGGFRPAIASSGGHHATFEGQRVYPFKFLLKHYPLRSQQHGERKVLRDRQPRWSPTERADGWHSQYNGIEPGHTFLRHPHDLWVYDERFAQQFLVERLSGVGTKRSPTTSSRS